LFGERPVPRARAEFIMVTFITFLRWVSGRDIYAVGIELPYPAPADFAPYREAFRCPVTFDAKGNCMIFALADGAAFDCGFNRSILHLQHSFCSRRIYCVASIG
jgi:hypothetical protein